MRTAAIRGLCDSHYDESQVEAWAKVQPPGNFPDTILERDFLVAEGDGEILGFGFVDRYRAEVEAIFVGPEFSRRGIGSELLARLETIARQAGLQRLTLSSSLNAVRFYQAAGYQAIGETTWHHPAGFSLACVAMAKDLI